MLCAISTASEIGALNTYSNYKNVVRLAEPDWNHAETSGLSGLTVDVIGPNRLIDQQGRELHHFCTTSYLGLDYHPALLEGATEALQSSGTLRIANSRNRSKLSLLEKFESELSTLFESDCMATLSCSSASAGALPLLAAGIFTNEISPTMVFDKHSHYSMNHLKAACADETEVITLTHNDIDQLEQLCKTHRHVAYIADGLYSMGGSADMDSLLYLKERYGLFLYLDDSHAISAFGERGSGYVRAKISEMDSGTIIVASLAKSFGASGGVIMLGNKQHRSYLNRYGGPCNWSQSLNAAAIGAGRASIRLHHSTEIDSLQASLLRNIRLFDSLVASEQSGHLTAIRLIRCGEPQVATEAASHLADHGFFTSTVFFPVVPRGKAAVRITLRADMSPDLIRKFCSCLKAFLDENNLNTITSNNKSSSP